METKLQKATLALGIKVHTRTGTGGGVQAQSDQMMPAKAFHGIRDRLDKLESANAGPKTVMGYFAGAVEAVKVRVAKLEQQIGEAGKGHTSFEGRVRTKVDGIAAEIAELAQTVTKAKARMNGLGEMVVCEGSSAEDIDEYTKCKPEIAHAGPKTVEAYHVCLSKPSKFASRSLEQQICDARKGHTTFGGKVRAKIDGKAAELEEPGLSHDRRPSYPRQLATWTTRQWSP